MREKQTCPSCGALRTDADLCPVCGYHYINEAQNQEQAFAPGHEALADKAQYEQAQKKSALVFCPKCGKKLAGAPKFCDQCGENLEHYRGGAAPQSAGIQPPTSKTLLYAIIAIVVIAGGIIGGMQFFGGKPEKTAADQQQPAHPPMGEQKTGPSQEALDAINQLNKMLAANPNDTAAMRNLADGYTSIQDFKSAIPYYQKYIAVNPRSSDVISSYAACLFQSGDIPSAVAQAKEAIRIDPKCQEAYFYLSIFSLNQNDMQASIAYLKKCIAIDSTTFVATQARNMLANHTQFMQQQ